MFTKNKQNEIVCLLRITRFKLYCLLRISRIKLYVYSISRTVRDHAQLKNKRTYCGSIMWFIMTLLREKITVEMYIKVYILGIMYRQISLHYAHWSYIIGDKQNNRMWLVFFLLYLQLRLAFHTYDIPNTNQCNVVMNSICRSVLDWYALSTYTS
jgi:hypothetical protein